MSNKFQLSFTKFTFDVYDISKTIDKLEKCLVSTALFFFRKILFYAQYNVRASLTINVCCIFRMKMSVITVHWLFHSLDILTFCNIIVIDCQIPGLKNMTVKIRKIFANVDRLKR